MDVEEEKNEMEIGGDSEEGGERREKSEDRLREDKDWQFMMEVGRRGGGVERQGGEGERGETGGRSRNGRDRQKVERRGGQEV